MKDQGASGDTVNRLVKESCGGEKRRAVSQCCLHTSLLIHTHTQRRSQFHKDKTSHSAHTKLNTTLIFWLMTWFLGWWHSTWWPSTLRCYFKQYTQLTLTFDPHMKGSKIKDSFHVGINKGDIIVCLRKTVCVLFYGLKVGECSSLLLHNNGMETHTQVRRQAA